MKRFFKKLFSANYCVNSNNVVQNSSNVKLGDIKNRGIFSCGDNIYFSASEIHSSSNIIINGKTFFSDKIDIKNGKIKINNEEFKSNSQIINVVINGNVDGSVFLGNGDLTINGNVNKDVQTQNGDVKVSGNVSGNAKTQMGDITCKELKGNASTQMGDIKVK